MPKKFRHIPSLLLLLYTMLITKSSHQTNFFTKRIYLYAFTNLNESIVYKIVLYFNLITEF